MMPAALQRTPEPLWRLVRLQTSASGPYAEGSMTQAAAFKVIIAQTARSAAPPAPSSLYATHNGSARDIRRQRHNLLAAQGPAQDKLDSNHPDDVTLAPDKVSRLLTESVEAIGTPIQTQVGRHHSDYFQIAVRRRVAKGIGLGLGSAECRHGPRLDLAHAQPSQVLRHAVTVGADEDPLQRQRKVQCRDAVSALVERCASFARILLDRQRDRALAEGCFSIFKRGMRGENPRESACLVE
jgi:hypothetical protein